MDARLTVFILFWGQLWWNPLLAQRKGPSVSSSPNTVPFLTTEVLGLGPTSITYSYQSTERGHPAKNGRQPSTAKPRVPEPEEPQARDDHFIAAVLIGVILIVMILIIVGIFLWKRWRKVIPLAPHWAGQSPFADGDVLDDTTEKDPTPATKRTSILSILPWKFNKDAQLLENADGHLGESTQNVAITPTCNSEETEKQSSTTAVSKPDFPASMQSQLSEGPDTLTDVPLHPDSPRTFGLSPPPNGIHGGQEEPCPNHTQLASPGPNVVVHCSVTPTLPHQTVTDVFLYPPPPEDFLSS
uniref:Protein EVI2B n=1 Tax=Salvator merianae TaxID=96440 RepID=A0A8D0CB29_SALMN